MMCTVFVCDRCNLRVYGEETFDGRSAIRNTVLWCAEPLDVEPRLFGRGAPCPTCGVRQALFADAYPVALGREEYEVSEATWALVSPLEFWGFVGGTQENLELLVHHVGLKWGAGHLLEGFQRADVWQAVYDWLGGLSSSEGGEERLRAALSKDTVAARDHAVTLLASPVDGRGKPCDYYDILVDMGDFVCVNRECGCDESAD